MEEVDILLPPMFEPSGQIKTRKQAYVDGDWIGTFNLWIVTRNPEPAIIYQQRSPRSTWAPNLLDVSAAGHYKAGEKLTDGLREVDEELGKHYAPDEIIRLGRRLFVGFNTNGTSHNNVVELYMIEDNALLEEYVLEEAEVYALCACPVRELLQAHQDPSYNFSVKARLQDGSSVDISVNQKSFPENWDDYHHKIALVAQRYFSGEKDLLY
ncbi:MAG TPA: NUDIX domain-containing protein [Candidatus Acidoferrum sp.]|nr:NUDIX domain-containing protein [Candidatus Acidoferrum sp.]